MHWSNEIEIALAKLPEEERRHFVVMAGGACGQLGDYIAAAGMDPMP